MEKTLLKSRAVLRTIEPGNTATCVKCDLPVKFMAKSGQAKQVIANVYIDGKWNRVEHYHAECYEELADPHGPASA